MDFNDSENLTKFSNFKLGSIGNPDRPCSTFFKILSFKMLSFFPQSLEVEQLDALQGQEFGEALENGNKTFLISPENVKPASKIAHISLDHDYEETCQNMKKNHKEKVKETLTNEVIDGRNYELVIRNGKEKFRCRLCPFPFLFGQISDLSRHIAIFHEGKIPSTNLVENETKEKIETEVKKMLTLSFCFILKLRALKS